MEVARILDSLEKGRIYGVIGEINLTTNTSKSYLVTDYKFLGTVKDYLNSPKDVASLKMVMLTEKYLNKESNELSEVEIKKVNLAKALIENKENIILDFFEKGLNDFEKKNFKRLFKKLAEDIHKTFLIYTNDILFLQDIASSIILVEDNHISRKYEKNEFFDLSNYYNIPEINKIINLIREKGIKLEDYMDVKDLLKAIYRIKEQE